MIILIGGSSHVGKTLIAQKLMERLSMPYISLDHLKMAFIRSGLTNIPVENDDEIREFLWPFASQIVKTAIENKQNLIMEGCYIPGKWRTFFDEQYLKEIACVFITMSEQYLRENFSLVCRNANIIEKRIDDRPDLERLVMCSKEFSKTCKENSIHNIEITENFDTEKIIAEILELRKFRQR